MVDFKSLETFVWVATLGSFRATAHKLNTTQPAISQRIAQLERELGVRLLSRDKRNVGLTAPGRELMVYAERLLQLRATMLGAIAEPSAMQGTLRLGVAETVVHTWLPRFIERLDATWPRLALELEVDISLNLRERLLAQEIDLAFLVGPLSDVTVRNLPLCRFPNAFIASPKIAFASVPVPVSELIRWPLITFAKNTQPYVAVRDLFAHSELGPPRLHASASLATVVRMALDGIGIAVIPPAIVREDVAAGRLRIVDAAIAVPDLAFTASWLIHPDTLVAERVAAMAAEIAAEDA